MLKMKKRSVSLKIFFLGFILLLSLPPATQAFWFSDRHTLVEIDETLFQAEDYLSWWRQWREPESPVPESPDEFIDWMLKVQDAERMQLKDNPEYRHKVEVFLKFRTLMLLKQEEIDSRLEKPSEADLRHLYNETYQPTLDLKILSLPSDKEVERVRKARRDGQEAQKAAEAAGLPETPLWKSARIRPLTVDGVLQELFTAPRKKGELLSLESGDGTSLLVEIVAIKEGCDEDFAQLKGKLEKKLRRQRNQKLNSDLIKRLRKKYKPLIHTEALAALHDNGGPEIRNTVIVEIDEVKVNGTRFLQIMAKERKLFQGRSGHSRISEEELKKRVVENIITQTLVGKEALARHYEERPPFKEVYDFYRRNRLNIAWKKVVIAPQVVISDSQVEAEYKRMADHFRQPEEVDVAWVRTADHELARKVQQELMEGRDFFKVMIPRFGAGIEMKKLPVGNLDPFLQEIIAGLAPGQISSPVEKGKEIVFVKLIRRHQGQPTPLANVAADLRKKLQRKRFSELEKEMLNKLRNLSSIKVKPQVWQRVHKNLLEESIRSGKN